MGVVLGLLGAGGSVLTLPILVYVCGIPPVLASTYSLGIVGATAAVGMWNRARRGHVAFRTALLFGGPSVAGVIAARRWLLPAIPEQVCRLGELSLTRDLLVLGVFAALMIAAGGAMILNTDAVNRSPHASQSTRPTPVARAVLVVLEGLIVGVITGLVGAGGGFLIVPALVLLLKLPIGDAIGTSLAIIAIKSLAGFLVDSAAWQQADWWFLLVFTSAAVAGMLIGTVWSRRVSTKGMRQGFGWFVVSVGCLMICKELTVFLPTTGD